jgi:hypothetical protein
VIGLPEDFERFESPTYSTEPIEFEEENIMEKIEPIIGILKENIRIIAAVIILLVVGLFVYDFFIGSMRQATLVIKNPEGEPLSKNRLRLLDSGGSEILALEGESRYALSLRAGTYRYEVTAPGYGTKRSSITVSASGETIPIIVEKDIDVEILDFRDAFPTEWVEGQKKAIEFEVKNNDSTAQEIEIVFGDDLEEWGNQSKRVTVPAKSTQTVIAQISIPKGLGIKDKRKGEEFKASARIKYTLEKQTKKFTVFPSPELRLRKVSVPSRADAGETLTKAEVQVENSSKFALHDLGIEIEITSAEKNNPSKVREWFKFQEKTGETEPWKIDIPTIDADSKITKEIRIDVPLTAKKETITGKIVVTASFLTQPLEKTFNLIIEKEAEFGLELSASDTIKIYWSEEKGGYEKATEPLKVKNVGTLPLSNIIISVKNYLVCSTDWLELLEQNIAALGDGEAYQITMIASAPIAQRGNETAMLCRIKYRFDNPLAGAPGEPDFIDGEMEGWISLEPQPD